MIRCATSFARAYYLKKNEPKKNGHVVIMVRITVDGYALPEKSGTHSWD